MFTTNMIFFPKKEASKNSNLLSPVISESVIGEWPGWTVLPQSFSQGLKPVTSEIVLLWGLSWVRDWLMAVNSCWLLEGSPGVFPHTLLPMATWMSLPQSGSVDQRLKTFCEEPKNHYCEHCWPRQASGTYTLYLIVIQTQNLKALAYKSW